MLKKSPIRFVILILFSLFVQNEIYAQVDSLYIEPFEQKLSGRVYFGKKYSSLTLKFPNEKDYEYHPNNPVGIGLGISWKNSTLSGAYGFGFMRDKSKGKTKSIDFQYHYYGQKVIFDVFFHDYKGFYMHREDDDRSDNITLVPDLKLVQYGLYSQYVFNNRKFSYKAAFGLSEKQLRSAGSFQLGGGVYYTKALSDSSLVSFDNYRQKNFQIGVSGGYIYTWVIKQKYFVSGGLSIGINAGSDNIRNFYSDKIGFYPSFFPRAAMGYHAYDWSIGLSYVNNRISLLFKDDRSVFLDTGSIQLTFVKRLNLHPPIVNKLPKRFR